MDFVTIISTVGFPIAMCVYLMVRFEKVLDNNTKSVDKLIDVIDRMCKEMNK
jgi:hypothetical protein